MKQHTKNLLIRIRDLLHLLNTNKLDWKKTTPIANMMINDTIIREIYEDIIKNINEDSSIIDNLKPEHCFEFKKETSIIYRSFPLIESTDVQLSASTSANNKKCQRSYLVYMSLNNELFVYCLTQSKFADGHKLEEKYRRKGAYKTFKTLIDLTSFEIKGILTLKNPNHWASYKLMEEIKAANSAHEIDSNHFAKLENVRTNNMPEKFRVIVEPAQYDLQTLINNPELYINSELRTKLMIGNESIEKWRLMVMYQLLSAIFNLHKLKICHRDLKPTNILVNINNGLKLTINDFGLHAKFGYQIIYSGTIGYIPREVFIYSSKIYTVNSSERKEMLKEYFNHLLNNNANNTNNDSYYMHRDDYEVTQLKKSIESDYLTIPPLEKCNQGAHDVYSLGRIFLKLLGYDIDYFMNYQENYASLNVDIKEGLLKLIERMLVPVQTRIKIDTLFTEFNNMLLINKAIECTDIPKQLSHSHTVITYDRTHKLRECIEYCYNFCINDNNKNISSKDTYGMLNCFSSFSSKRKKFGINLFDKKVCDMLDSSYKFFDNDVNKIYYKEFAQHLKNMSTKNTDELSQYQYNLSSWQIKLENTMPNIDVPENEWVNIILNRIFASVLIDLCKMKLDFDLNNNMNITAIYQNLLQCVENATIPEAHNAMSYTKRYGLTI